MMNEFRGRKFLSPGACYSSNDFSRKDAKEYNDWNALLFNKAQRHAVCAALRLIIFASLRENIPL